MKNSPARDLLWFYLLAVSVVVAVMGASFYFMARNPMAAGVLERLYAFIQSEQSYGNVVIIVRYALREPLCWLVIVFASAPTIAALAVALARGSLRDLLSRLRPWRGVAPRRALHAYAWLFGLQVAVSLAILAAVGAFAPTGSLDAIYRTIGGGLVLAALVVLLGGLWDEGGLLEELGWRGFAHPRLQAVVASPLTAAIVLGTLWWAWHLPRESLTLLATGVTSAFVMGQLQFLVLCIALSVVIAWFVNRTGGSVIPAILIHGGTNVWAKALSAPLYPLLGFSVRDALVVAFALLLLTLVGPRLGRDQESVST